MPPERSCVKLQTQFDECEHNAFAGVDPCPKHTSSDIGTCCACADFKENVEFYEPGICDVCWRIKASNPKKADRSSETPGEEQKK